MAYAGSHGKQEYKCPVASDDPKRKSITCYFQVYQNVQKHDHDAVYKISNSELRHFPFTDILTQVNLTVSDDGNFHVTDDEMTEIRSGVAKVSTKTKTCNNHICSSYRERELSHSQTNAEGIVRLQMQPEQQRDRGLLRSARVRTILLYDL